VAYTLSCKAEDDLIEIYIEGVSLFGVNQTDQYLRKIEEMIVLLSGNPGVARERLEISPPVRIHPFLSHLIVYVVDDNDDIFIIRIRHGHEDWQSNPW
jgi:toxin ParE1/3/4